LAPPKEAVRKNATLKMDRFFENATQNVPAPEKIPPLEKSTGQKVVDGGWRLQKRRSAKTPR
jgi:hypothetical protein